MATAAKSEPETRKLRPRRRHKTLTAGLLNDPVHERRRMMPSDEPETHEPADPSREHAGHDGDGADVAPSREFAGAEHNFGLTPRPKVKTQRTDPLLGMDLGGVKIIRLIGEGGMGRVYEARQEKPARTVAVKIIRAGITSEKTMKRFEREAEFLGRLQHPGIAQIFIVGTYSSDLGDVPFYVLEHVANAKPITNYAHDHGLSLTDRLRLFKQVCEAVSHGHDRSIVHRDLKPGNILVDAEGNPKVIDFGVARSTDSDLALEAMKTDTGQMIGTVQYMAPEQFGPNPDDLNSRTDVYALGVVLYELLSGVPPYSVSKRALHEASRVVCEQIPTPLRSLDKSIPRDVSAICERCLQKTPRHRYHSAGELAADLGRFLSGQPVRAQPSGLAANSRRLASRWNVLAAATLVPVVGLLGWVYRDRLPDFESRQPQTISLNVTADWSPTSISVVEGRCYRLKATGQCKGADGESFGPEGTAAPEYRVMLGPPRGMTSESSREQFVRNLPRQMLLAKVSSRSLDMAVGPDLTFIAPATGALAFRMNERTRDAHTTGRLEITLQRLPEPRFVDEEGETTIRTRVGEKDYLLFRPDGLQWQYTTLLKVTDGEQPTLINGIAWWPERDPYDTVRSKVLKTRQFAWAANPRGPKPLVVNVPTNDPLASVTPEGPVLDQPGLKFSDPADGDGEIGCTMARQTAAGK
jgi:serine/threonine protein kinase